MFTVTNEDLFMISRTLLGVSQVEFSKIIGISTFEVRQTELGRRSKNGLPVGFYIKSGMSATGLKLNKHNKKLFFEKRVDVPIEKFHGDYTDARGKTIQGPELMDMYNKVAGTFGRDKAYQFFYEKNINLAFFSFFTKSKISFNIIKDIEHYIIINQFTKKKHSLIYSHNYSTVHPFKKQVH